MDVDGKNLYSSDAYFDEHPSLHSEDSAWKVENIAPFLNLITVENGKEFSILDVGGGAGLILRDIGLILMNDKKFQIRKFALDLSPMALSIQKENNPDVERLLNEDICHTSLEDKEIDLVLMIDVLEHIPNPIEALRELRRIAHYIILIVPLEMNLTGEIWNLMNRGRARKDQKQSLGHVNFFTYSEVRALIEKYLGKIINHKFQKVFRHRLKNNIYPKGMFITPQFIKLLDPFACVVQRISPRLCSLLLNSPVVIMIECY